MSAEMVWAKFDGMTWPAACDRAGDVQWLLRYGPEALSMADRLVAASIVAAYCDLVTCDRDKRNRVVREVRRASIAVPTEEERAG